ncbi:MAG: ComEC/Rec2 family competence protein [bacterium]|nr:ComEC/Rec2 family competence protein [bacterium]
MHSYDIFFFGIVFFLIGVLAASFGIRFLIIIVATMLLAAIFLFLDRVQTIPIPSRTLDEVGANLSESTNPPTKMWVILAIISVFILLGAGYYKWDDSKFKDIKIDFNKEINFSGLVVDDPQYSSNTQNLTVQLGEPRRGRISVKLMLYPKFHYGDELIFKGKIEKPSDSFIGQIDSSYVNYLAKEKINGLSGFPEAKLEKSGMGSKIKSALFNFKHSIIDSYQKVLPPNQAALLAGLIFGERGNLDKDFKQAMSLSGTTHLTALSGQNITIIVVAIAAAIGFIFPQSMTFAITILVILGFVAMTGFDPSAVRATIMGFIVLLANLAGRIYEPRNSIVLAAFLITLFNPKSLVFDVGFQLSFLAVLGIIYLRPALKKILRFGDKPGFFAWRENFLMTLSAQLATAPILIIAFGNFSLLALISNILILIAIPLTMAFGFLIGFFHLFSYYLALLSGWLVSLLLTYEIFIINFFAKMAAPVNFNLNFWGILLYYLLLTRVIVYVRNKA